MLVVIDNGRNAAGIADAESSPAAYAPQAVHGVAMGLRCVLAHLASELPTSTVRPFHFSHCHVDLLNSRLSATN